jgi:hypothetical protein
LLGITTFIETELGNGVKWRVEDGYWGTKGSEPGKQIGRVTDTIVRKVFEKRLLLDSNNPMHSRAHLFFAALTRRKIRLVRVQIPVTVPDLKLKTTLDAMGVNEHGEDVVIELKTTQLTHARLSRIYHTPLSGYPTLKTGLPNTLYWRHQLQTGFGMLASSTHRGLVVVCSEDGVLVSDVNTEATLKKRFVSTQTTEQILAAAPKRQSYVRRLRPFVVTPKLKELLMRVNLTVLVKSTATVHTYQSRDGSTSAVVGMINGDKRYTGGKGVAAVRLALLAKARTLKTATKKAYIASASNGRWDLTLI